ncbi:MAG TPA: tetratricopeptide repeat protein [Vicinamibacterales bacterium]|nr:tetratricopeptide repeat protein [Vicinamibacterales bacterium]
MKSDSIAYVIAGMCFGVILGWVIGTQQARRQAPAPAAQAAATDGQAAGAGNTARQAPALDQGRVQALTTILKSDPKNLDAVIQLGNTYFDAEQWDDAIQWYTRAVQIDPKNADASTDLGVSLYYSNKADEALKQFEHSLAISPNHTKTLLNKGIVLAFGKQDLRAAAAEWEKVVTLAPDSPEGQAARRALEGIAAAHAGGGAATSNQ